MQYSKIDLVLFEVKGIPQTLLRELTEFLRLNMIIPIARNMNGGADGDQDCGFNGYFTKADEKKVERWLQERDIPFKQINRE